MAPTTEERKIEKPVKGFFSKGKIIVLGKDAVQSLSEKGHGEMAKRRLELAPCEALYLLREGWLDVYEKGGVKLSIEELLRLASETDSSTWSKYLVYRDLRDRGYVVKLGFGKGADFRVYDRGAYGKDAARIVVSTVLEGEPAPVKDWVVALGNALSAKKDLVLAVIERRGEIVYYSLSQFNF